MPGIAHFIHLTTYLILKLITYQKYFLDAIKILQLYNFYSMMETTKQGDFHQSWPLILLETGNLRI